VNSIDAPRFEAMTTGGLLDRTFRLYAANFPLLLGITAAAYVPFYAVQMYLQARMNAGEPNLGAVILTFFLSLLWMSVAAPVAFGAATYAVSERYLGRDVAIGESLGRACKRLWTLGLAQLSVSIRVMIGLLLLIIPGILWMLSYSLVIPVIMVEGQKAEASLKRSWQLVKDYRKKVFAVLLVLMVIQGLVSYGAANVASMFLDTEIGSGQLLQSALANVTSMFLTPLIIVADILLYYDLRIRKEGFDLEMLSRDLGPAPETAAVAPAAVIR